ncbi:uncharacterized protein CANTADRAFT_8128 [Suhomyces tanzawaensis NRRL Y-17324]|uniref:polynucleotide adenylyltransferase n=1 Tax=Suhomyces tanzawaensis NRRL Y-17324 TaxID=984487 RepID=A0A1E4SBS7_9ASCO|nr:uncharacterized protein CANTADRAFT_8128 [Suhomyces tanzawaensis NRRL Y-17324]ODV76951.1 hypothetical protein CANTADRAFT_8128 [Suhomyces tanzawaensis NRRL Y-17324]
MANKRKREPSVAKPKSKKQKKKLEKSIVPSDNKFSVLPGSEDDVDHQDYIFDYEGKNRDHPELVLLDSDEDSDAVIVESEGEQVVEVESEEEQPPSKKAKVEYNELSKNADFIGFGEISSEEEEDYHDEQHEGILTMDENGEINETTGSLTNPYPWIKDHDHSKQKEIADWLTLEMKDFVNYISPSSREIHTRNGVINQLKSKIKEFWPSTDTYVFGSSATDLYLPGSDIDMVIVSDTGDYEQRSRLYQLSSYLRNMKLAKNIEVIAGAKVPIIKFVDPKSNIHIDISFERKNGIEAAKKIRKWLSTTPGLREMVLIVKQFLRSRKLNNVHVGGLGGYSTIILCYHFMKLHPKLATNTMNALDNLGALLIEFFELYGRNFSYDNLIIALDPETDLPKYLLKLKYKYLDTSRNPFSIIIQDPSDPSNNITRSSYNLRDIKKAFGGAYQLLVEKCYSLNGSSYKSRIGNSILGDIIKFNGSTRDFNDDRDKVKNHALIQELEEEEDPESDGAEGNDKYYFSDMTVESDSEIVIPNEKPKEQVKKPKQEPAKAKETKKIVSSYLGLEDDDREDDEEEDVKEAEERESARKSSLDKNVRRDYWRQKGLEL